MRKKVFILAAVLFIGIFTLIFILNNQKDVYAVYENGQMGIVTGNNKVLVENQKVEVYHTFSNSIQIYYESYDLDNTYHNTIIINDNHEISLTSSSNENAKFIENEISILGLNIVDGKLKLAFNSGIKYSDNFNTFSLRNIYIKVDGVEVWSNEYPKSDYFNEPINFGEDDLNDDVRFNYMQSETLSFTIDKKLLDVYGFVLDREYQKEEISVTNNKKEFIIKNESLVNIDCNITNGEIINDSKVLQVTKTNDITYLKVKMDGVEIPNELALTKGAWASGEHYLNIEAINKHGFKTTKVITFTLADATLDSEDSVKYQIYQTGVSTSLNAGINNMGVMIDSESQTSTLNVDGQYLSTAYSESPVISFVVEKGEKTSLIWNGKANVGRTVFMQIYNHDVGLWETVSTKMILENENVTLGYNYLGQSRYVNNDLIYVRISSVLNNLSMENITNQIFHVTDIQYIIQILTKSGVDSALGKQALKAIQSMVDYIITQYQNDNLMYFLLTGDLVQQQKGVTVEEWTNFQSYVLNPFLEAGVPLGVSSGNHDVGGVSSYNPTGVNTLDENLVYDYYSDYVGESVFENLEYYGESYNNNRSHYDVMTINGHEFLFLYLGWGSSIPGIHVSVQDIEWAKTILTQYPDKTVVLATHEYMNNKGSKSFTGEYVFKELVKKYKNIKFVFSGHINGTSSKIDAIDDDGDGINDRLVLQLLTDFQEEEKLYGASFIRTIGLDYVNNVMYFNIYSPYFKDSDIILDSNDEYHKEAKEFYYAFDLTNCGYGISTDYFG